MPLNQASVSFGLVCANIGSYLSGCLGSCVVLNGGYVQFEMLCTSQVIG